MLDRLGTVGIVGLLLLVGGIALVAYADPVVAAGIALVIAGTGLVVKGLATNLLRQFGFA
ncbi:DUF7470 family protein [Halorarum salinum]|uniref:Major facilitator superfamily (MFS) profile domain-containing protein n=1 Tax=Halorarum salinum TaxID=2743089 RepID=A0A7D5QER3_9EURY|nr:hypothetical protein [Halobaculum salinum]QLG60863.1 hypothetical protein HUG12_03520 [Halobaculum salinum]